MKKQLNGRHGGRRQNAGRPPLDIDFKAKSVKLRDTHWAIARRIGMGNMSAGIRIALNSYQPAPPKQPGDPKKTA